MGVITSRSLTQQQQNNWFGLIRRKLFRPSPSHDRQTTTLIVGLRANNITFNTNTLNKELAEEGATAAATTGEIDLLNAETDHTNKHYYFLSQDDVAAIIIQSYFRRHLARRAFRAPRSLVKLQGVVREVIARRQARIALDCMHALARLHVTVRARQLLRITNY